MLVPGAGLGRLVFEIARQGYSCQGNEFSLFMLIASHFVLNRQVKSLCTLQYELKMKSYQIYLIFFFLEIFCIKISNFIFLLIKARFSFYLYFRCNGTNLHQLYPWIHQCDNNLDTKDQLASIYFPDVNLSESIPKNSQFSMVAGDFLEVSFKIS